MTLAPGARLGPYEILASSARGRWVTSTGPWTHAWTGSSPSRSRRNHRQRARPGLDGPAGTQVIERAGVTLGLDPSTYVFTRSELQRNLFRIPLH